MHERESGGKNPLNLYGVRLSLWKTPELHTYSIKRCVKENGEASLQRAGLRRAGVCRHHWRRPEDAATVSGASYFR